MIENPNTMMENFMAIAVLVAFVCAVFAFLSQGDDNYYGP